jgi:EAL and modified HD-GYP domain-containing signal transduction protein
MKSFFQSLWSRLLGTATLAESTQLPSFSNTQPQPLSASPTIGARRPLISSHGQVSGFEFRINQRTQQRLNLRTDRRGQAAYVSAVLTSAHLVATSGRIGFARVPLSWLLHASDLPLVAGIWVGLEQHATADQDSALIPAALQAVQRLRAAGAKLGWDVMSNLPIAPDFVLQHQNTAAMTALLAASTTWPESFKSLPLLVTDISNTNELELALAHGVSFACGAMSPPEQSDEPKETLAISPAVKRVSHLLNRLVMGSDTSEIVQEIKGDVGLSYQLLGRINSASYAQLHEGASIEQAVVMLGRNELYRWLSLLMVEFAENRKISAALQEVVLWRSRLLELLAIEQQEAAPGLLFTLGLASLLGQILNISLPDVVTVLKLPKPAQQALLEQSGPWHPYLQIARQVETQELDPDSALAQEFGGAERVLALSDQAWAWAAEHTARPL